MESTWAYKTLHTQTHTHMHKERKPSVQKEGTEMAQWEWVHVAKPPKRNLSPRTQIVEGEK